MVLYLCRMCQCGLHEVVWSHIGILMGLLAAEPRSSARLFIAISVSLWNNLADPHSMVWNWWVLCAGLIHFHWPKQFTPPLSFTVFLFFLCILWYCGTGLFGLIGCKSLSPSISLPTFFNNNNNNNLPETSYLVVNNDIYIFSTRFSNFNTSSRISLGRSSPTCSLK